MEPQGPKLDLGSRQDVDTCPSENPVPGRCSHFVRRKKRFCKMVVSPGKRFCGEHAQEGEDNRKRIPCPLDPKHTVYEDQLQKHLKKCNSREKPLPVYHVQNVNAGNPEKNLCEDQVPISSLSSEDIQKLIEKLRQVTSGLEPALPDKKLSHHVLQEALNDPVNGESAAKHLKQQPSSALSPTPSYLSLALVPKTAPPIQDVVSPLIYKEASILGHLESLGLLGGSRCYVEFGAGRGKLSHWVDIATQDAENVLFLLVERATTRFKVDGKQRKSAFERLHIDIQHLSLDQVPSLVQKQLPVVGIGKHLCGAGTDLALRCLVQTSSSTGEPRRKRPRMDPVVGSSDLTRKVNSVPDEPNCVAGIVIALCCHHRCDWQHYVGKDFFLNLGLGQREFGFFQRMSSWATCGLRKLPVSSCVEKESGSDIEEHNEADQKIPDSNSEVMQGLLTAEDRENVGHLCKRLLDRGRVDYLQRMGFKATLQYYTGPEVSLENVLLTALPQERK